MCYDSDEDHEESICYGFGGYHPVQVGDLYCSRYLRKKFKVNNFLFN